MHGPAKPATTMARRRCCAYPTPNQPPFPPFLSFSCVQVRKSSGKPSHITKRQKNADEAREVYYTVKCCHNPSPSLIAFPINSWAVQASGSSGKPRPSPQPWGRLHTWYTSRSLDNESITHARHRLADRGDTPAALAAAGLRGKYGEVLRAALCRAICRVPKIQHIVWIPNRSLCTWATPHGGAVSTPVFDFPVRVPSCRLLRTTHIVPCSVVCSHSSLRRRSSGAAVPTVAPRLRSGKGTWTGPEEPAALIIIKCLGGNHRLILAQLSGASNRCVLERSQIVLSSMLRAFRTEKGLFIFFTCCLRTSGPLRRAARPNVVSSKRLRSA